MAIVDPKLSIVVTSRNDEHGGNLLQRMQLFVNGFLEQCRKYNLDAELVLVEWNPPPDKPSLADALIWPSDKGPCAVRIIQASALAMKNKTNPYFLITLGKVFYKLGRIEDAEKVFLMTYQSEPKNTVIKEWLQKLRENQ